MDVQPSAALAIRPGMDVYDSYQNAYIGTVVDVVRSPTDPNVSSTTRDSSGSVARHFVAVHAPANDAPSSKTLGEEIGPVPTIVAGNTGPVNQSAQSHYATHRYHPETTVEWLVVRPGRINLGILTPPIYIPASAIESLSMERIVVRR